MRKPITIPQLRRLIEQRLPVLRQAEASMKNHNGHPQILECLQQTKGEINVLELIQDMIQQKRHKPLTW